MRPNETNQAIAAHVRSARYARRKVGMLIQLGFPRDADTWATYARQEMRLARLLKESQS